MAPHALRQAAHVGTPDQTKIPRPHTPCRAVVTWPLVDTLPMPPIISVSLILSINVEVHYGQGGRHARSGRPN